MAPFIARSMTKGAVMRSCRRPATKVVVFQWPCGTALTSRLPRSARPRRPRHVGRGAGLVDEDQLRRIKTGLAVLPGRPRRLHVRPRLLGGVRGFF